MRKILHVFYLGLILTFPCVLLAENGIDQGTLDEIMTESPSETIEQSVAPDTSTETSGQSAEKEDSSAEAIKEPAQEVEKTDGTNSPESVSETNPTDMVPAVSNANQVPIAPQIDRTLAPAPLSNYYGPPGFNKPVFDIALQPDARILVSGAFSVFDGYQTGRGIARLLPYGDLDDAFRLATKDLFTKAEFYSVALQPDGKILLGGMALMENDNPDNWRSLIRLHASGALDTGFLAAVGEGFDSPVLAVEVQSDGKILVGGNFQTYNGTPVGGLARLFPSGELDQGFNQQIGKGVKEFTSVKSIAIQPNGRIMVAGDFDTFNQRSVDGFIRLMGDGSLDVEFSSRARTGFFVGFYHDYMEEDMDTGIILSDVAIQPDGKIILGGEFVSYGKNDTVYASRIIRFDSEGNLDMTFVKKTLEHRFKADVASILVQPDNQIVVGSVDPFSRLGSDGTHDPKFLRLAGYGFRGKIDAMVNQENGKILVGGKFNSYKGIKVGNIARINPDGTLDEKFIASYR